MDSPMAAGASSGHGKAPSDGLEVLERNITGVPITDNQLLRMFNALAGEGAETVSFDTVLEFYNGLEHLGVPQSEQESMWAVTEFAKTQPGCLTYPEFACFMLKISQCASLIPGHNNNRHLTSEEIENNIGGLPVTDNRIQELFDAIDVDHTGTVSVDAVKEFYRSLEHYGLDPSEKETDETVRKYATTSPDSLTYEEFSCFVLSLAQW